MLSCDPRRSNRAAISATCGPSAAGGRNSSGCEVPAEARTPRRRSDPADAAEVPDREGEDGSMWRDEDAEGDPSGGREALRSTPVCPESPTAIMIAVPPPAAAVCPNPDRLGLAVARASAKSRWLCVPALERGGDSDADLPAGRPRERTGEWLASVPVVGAVASCASEGGGCSFWRSASA